MSEQDPPSTPSPRGPSSSKKRASTDSEILKELKSMRKEQQRENQEMRAKFDTFKSEQAIIIEQLRRENQEFRDAANAPQKFDFRTQPFTKEICLTELNPLQCITKKETLDRNSGKKLLNHVLNFEFPIENTWFQNPIPEYGSKDTIGLFKPRFRRPIANRYLSLSSGSAITEDKTTHSFMTGFPVKCVSDQMQAFLVSNPLVTSLPATQKKFLTLPESVFKTSQVTFSEIPLFSISDYHSRQALAALLAVDQLNNELKERVRVITDNWDLNKRIAVVDGHYTAVDAPHDDLVTLGDSYTKESMFNELMQMRTGYELNYFGFQNAMDYQKANIIASRHDGRRQVLAHLNSGPGSVSYENLNGSAYNAATLFGPVSESFTDTVRTERQAGHNPVYLKKYHHDPVSRSFTDTRSATAKRPISVQQGSAVKRTQFHDRLPRISGRGRGGNISSRPAKRPRGRGRGRGSYQGPKNSTRQVPSTSKS